PRLPHSFPTRRSSDLDARVAHRAHHAAVLGAGGERHRAALRHRVDRIEEDVRQCFADLGWLALDLRHRLALHADVVADAPALGRSEEHTSELQSLAYL